MKTYVQIPTINVIIDTGAESPAEDLLLTVLAAEKFAIEQLQLLAENSDEQLNAELLEEVAHREQLRKQLLLNLEQLSQS